MDLLTLSKAKNYVQQKIEEAGGMTSEGVSKIVEDNIDNAVAKSQQMIDIKKDLAELITKSFTVLNMKVMGCDNTGVRDSYDIIQTILDAISTPTVLYFPAGVYTVSKGLKIANDYGTQFRGDFYSRNGSGRYGSVLQFADDVDGSNNVTITDNSKDLSVNGITLIDASNCWNFSISDMELRSTSAKWVDNGMNDEIIPYAQYSMEYTHEYVNAIRFQHAGTISNCRISGFSGYGIANSQAMQINQVHIEHCKNGIYLAQNDLGLHDSYITKCECGIYASTTRNVMVYDTFFDLIAGYGIYSKGNLGGKIDAVLDHCVYAAIYAANALNEIDMNIRAGRTGMYYAGLTYEEVKAREEDTTMVKMSKYAAVCTQHFYNCTLIYKGSSRHIDDTQKSVKLAPALHIFVSNGSDSQGVIIGTDVKTQIVSNDISTNRIMIVDNNGVTRGNQRASMVTTSNYDISDKQKALFNAGDMWVNIKKKTVDISLGNGEWAKLQDFLPTAEGGVY